MWSCFFAVALETCYLRDKMNYSRICILVALFVGLLSMLWFVIAALLDENVPNVLQPQGDYMFDYVVVGAGSSGSVVASLLSRHSNATVLLVEAGDRFGILSKIPLLTTFQQKGINDWAFLSTPQMHSSKGLEGEKQCLPRGKGLGGSAQLNYMLHFDGWEGDFERWSRDFKLTDWDWPSFRPFLQAGNPKPYERLEIAPDYSKIAYALHRAQTEFGHKPWRFRNAQYTIRNGLRYSVYHRFLQSAYKRKNLKIMVNTLAKSIKFQNDALGPNQVSVKYLLLGTKDKSNGKEQVLQVQIMRELILCAGAYQTPQILMASGLGNYDELKKLRISTPTLLPSMPLVGQGLHDHLNLPLYISIDTVGPTLNQKSLLNPWSLFKYITVGGGHLGNIGVLGHIDNLSQNLSDTYSLMFFAAGAIDESALMSISNFKKSHFRALFPRYHNTSQEGFVLISSCLQPMSRGSVKIKSSNIRRNPLIDPNYMSEQVDVECTIKAIRAAIEVVTSEAFSSLGVHIHWPRIKECANFGPFERDLALNQPNDRYLECIIRYVGLGSHHPGGTCKMGTDASNSVVNSQFKVHGIGNLRIMDASVLPAPISGNPNSIVVGMATRGAAMVLKDLLHDSQN